MSDTAKENRITSSGYTAGVMTFSKYTLDTIPGVPPHYMIYQHKESYRYDALGRRVWVELVRDTNCTTHDVDSDCSNYVRRVNWDGDQILHETQVAADTGKFNAILEGGSVTYVHGGTVDQPLEVYKASNNLILPYTNWHGQFVRGTCAGTGCAGVQYPLSDASAYDDIQGGVAQGTWFGTLIKGQIDASGYEYKRNRYYNPSTGRFNQEDPVGLAGGLNVYGYASGDPANYSDPFGLMTLQGWEIPVVVGGGAVEGWLAGAAATAAAYVASRTTGIGAAIGAAVNSLRDKATLTFVTYTRTNPENGQVYSGRTSGFGSPQNIVNARTASHPDRLDNFGPPVVDRAASGYNGYMAIRGREQQLIDSHGGAQSEGGNSANIIRGVSRGNPLAGEYNAASNAEFGPIQ